MPQQVRRKSRALDAPCAEAEDRGHMRPQRWRWRVLSATVTTSLLMIGWPALNASAAGGPNIAADQKTAASSAGSGKAAGNIADGQQSTYWEGASSALPQWVQSDLGKAARIDQVTLKLPADWKSRRQTLSLQGSADGTSFSTLKTSAAYTFAPGSSNKVTISFPATKARFVRANITANTEARNGQLAELEVRAAAESSVNLAAGRTLTASSYTQNYIPAQANDGNAASYWESRNGDLPQWIQADLGSSVRVDRVVLRLPDGWETRTQTLKIQGSTNGSDFTDLTQSRAYTFSPTAGESATITFDATTTRYVRVLVSANSVQPGAQVSELEVYGPDSGDTQAPTAPTQLAYTEPATGQIKLTWKASTDNVAVTGYDIYANNTLLTSVAGSVTTFTDTRPGDATVSYYVRAKDAAGNASANSNTVTRTGSSGDTQAPTAPTGLSFTEQTAGQIKLTWQASTDNKGVTGYDIYANNVLRKSVAGDVTTYTDAQSTAITVSYTVRARTRRATCRATATPSPATAARARRPTSRSASPSPPRPSSTRSSRRTPTTTA